MEKQSADLISDLPKLSDIDLGVNGVTDGINHEPVNSPVKIDPEKPKKSRRKLYIFLVSLGVVLLISAFFTWLFVFKGIYVFQGLPLSSFSNSYYSIKIPEGYVSSENNLGDSGSDVTFTDPDEKSEGVQSKVYVVSGVMSKEQKNNYFNALDKQYSKSNIKKSHSSTGLNGAVDIIYSSENWNGLESRIVSYTMSRDKDRLGKYDKLVVYKSGKIYEIVITSPKYNPGLAVDVKKVFESFEIK